MKKLIFILIILIVLGLVGCNTGNRESQSTPASAENILEKSFIDSSELEFEIDGIRIKLDTDATNLLEIMDSDHQKTEAISCVYSEYGKDKSFIYDDIEIYTYPQPGNLDFIDEIVIKTDRFSTDRGIKPGSTLTELKNTYKDITDLGGGMYVIAPEGSSQDATEPCLYFILDNETVSTIHFYAVSNMP